MIDRRLFALSARLAPLLWAQGLISLTLTTMIIGQMFLLSGIIHAVFMDGRSLSEQMPALSWLIGVILLRAALIAAQQMISQRGAIRIKSDLRKQVYNHLIDTGAASLQRLRSGAITACLTEGLEKIDAYFARYIPRAIAVSIIPLVMVFFVLSIDLLSGSILLLTGPLIPVFMWLIGSMAEKRTQKQWGALSLMSTHFLDTLQGLTTLRLFGRTDAHEKEMVRISNRYRLTTLGVLKIAFLSGLVLEMAASLSTAIVAVQIGVRLVEGHIPFQLGLFVLLLAPEFYLPFRQLGTEHHAAMEGRAAANQLFALLHTPTLPTVENPSIVPAAPFHIQLHHVGYTYPDREDPALDTVSLQLPPHSVTALVGTTGAGKSTLFHMLCRHLDPDHGSITVNGVSLASMDPAAWRHHVALVPQRPALFTGTLLDNLRLAKSDATLEEVQQAAQQAEAHSFIQSLPQGYDTPVGEQAWRLSGGERQRLAIARAFLKNAPLLLLDEPAAHLDPDSEERIAAAYERLARNRTVVVIAHRLRTVYRAQQIIVMDKGQILEQGRHAELIRLNGRYAQMVGGSA